MAARKSTDDSADKSSDALEQVLRLFTILHLVTSRRDGQRISRAHLARACECSTKTVSRAVKLLREAQIPIDYDEVTRTYKMLDKGWALTTSALSASDVLALTLACALQADETSPFADETRKALEKITLGMPPALCQLLEQTTQALQTSGGMARDYSRAPLRLLLAASAQRQTIEMLYDSRSSGRCERRLVDPYVVEMRDGRYWEMQAWCHKDERVKTFALDRVLEARTTGARFVVRPWERSSRGVVGGLRGGDWVELVVRFDAVVTPWAKDRQWPFDVEYTAEADGGVIMRGQVRGLEGIVRELLSWRRHAVVLGGPELRARMAEEVQAMAAHYADTEKIENT
jgi:predicted DNA-binding transcriptional regulator YafY